MKNKIIRDPIHGYISINDIDLKFIDTSTFQRLRRVKQSGCYTVYPSSNHTRFEHSIGVMHLSARVFETVTKKIPDDQIDEIKPYLECFEKTVRYACLLHDVGHTPLSHTGEALFDIKSLKKELLDLTKLDLDQGSEHEYLSCIVALTVFKKEIEELGLDQELFCRMITGTLYPSTDVINRFKNGLIQILNSSIDVDKLDYFSRDSFSSGTGNTLVSIDTERLVNAYNIIRGVLCFDSSALSVVANFVYARHTLYMWVYNHHITVYTDNIIKRYLLRLIEKHPEIKDEMFSVRAIIEKQVDDYDVFYLIKKYKDSDPLFQSIYKQFFERNYFKPVWKNQYSLKEFFSGADAQLDQFREASETFIESELIKALHPSSVNKIFVFKTDYKFKKPKVFLNLNNTTIDFASIYQHNIYNSLLDVIPMIFVDKTIGIELVKGKIKELFILK